MSEDLGLDLGQLLEQVRGDASFAELSRRAGGVPSGARLHQLKAASEGAPIWTVDGDPITDGRGRVRPNRKQKAIPELATLFGIRRLTRLDWTPIMLAALRTCGVDVPATVTDAQEAPIIAAVRSIAGIELVPHDEYRGVVATLRVLAEAALGREKDGKPRRSSTTR